MNITDLPLVVIGKIIDTLNIVDTVSLSEVNKFFNYNCKKKNNDFFSRNFKFNNDILTPELFPEIHLPILNIQNYLICSNAWKKIIFFLRINIDINYQRFIIMDECPGNILFSISGARSISTYSIHPTVKLLDSSCRSITGPKEVSHHLEYLNISENYYVPSSLDFSGRNLKFLNMSLCNLGNLKFNFSKTLSTISIFGCYGIKNLEGFEHVENLIIDYCYEITSLEEIKNVKNLSMRNCSNIKSVAPLKECIQLDISYTGIKDVSMLKKLRKVIVSGIENLRINTDNTDVITLVC